jgi:hypothetical protein
MKSYRLRRVAGEVAACGLLLGMATGMVANSASAAKPPNENVSVAITAPESDTGTYTVSGDGTNKKGTASSDVQGTFQLSHASIVKDKPASATFTVKATPSSGVPGSADFAPTTFSGKNISGSLGGSVSPANPGKPTNVSVEINCTYNPSTDTWRWTITIRWRALTSD